MDRKWANRLALATTNCIAVLLTASRLLYAQAVLDVGEDVSGHTRNRWQGISAEPFDAGHTDTSGPLLRTGIEPTDGPPAGAVPPLLSFTRPANESLLPVNVLAQQAELPRMDAVDLSSDLGPLPPAPADEGYGTGYGQDLQWGFWGWLTYWRIPQADLSTFWAWEAEFDVTKTFTEGIAATAEIDFVDANPEPKTSIEQLFLSVVLPHTQETIFTAGKFNSPFGVERRDFWNRLTDSPSLLFFAQPLDLVGLMLTHRVLDKGLIFRPMIVNGWNNNLDINEQPSLALMLEYDPCEKLRLAITSWRGPEFPQRVGDKLYFVEAQAVWYVVPEFSLSGEFLYGNTESPLGRLDWHGFLALGNYDINERWHVFVQWSLLDDSDAYLTGVAEQRQEIDSGFGWYLHQGVEVRSRYRHDFRPHSGDRDQFLAHVTFGY